MSERGHCNENLITERERNIDMEKGANVKCPVLVFVNSVEHANHVVVFTPALVWRV